MARHRPELLTVTPPILERSGFENIDRALALSGPVMCRDWLLARFQEGLQLRMLRAPDQGFIAFTPGRSAWTPIDGAGDAVVVHDLRAGPQSMGPATVRRLWAAVEDWARFYGFAAVLAQSGPALGLIPPEFVTGRGYHCLDRTEGNTRLMGKILHGPISLPRLPQDWTRRAACLGPGLVIQSTGLSVQLEARAQSLLDRARKAGLAARHDRLETAHAARTRSVSPVALFSVVLDGAVIPSDGLSEMQIWSAIRRRSGPGDI
ncbi:hypothetical protein [Rhodophyticola porphyridii]|uniref:hypothetical protein n=1 Tax=Rhodophyticola porphyridii TaxID=1852017 RepID=UPI0035D01417